MPDGLLLPGQRLARGVARHLRGRDFATLLEFVPAPGLRVDVIALGPKGEIGSSSASPAGPTSSPTSSGAAISNGATAFSGPSMRTFRPTCCPLTLG